MEKFNYSIYTNHKVGILTTSLGGADNPSDYEGSDTRPGNLQMGHLMRSIHWASNHLKSDKVKQVISSTSNNPGK